METHNLEPLNAENVIIKAQYGSNDFSKILYQQRYCAYVSMTKIVIEKKRCHIVCCDATVALSNVL